MNSITRYGATLITSAAILAGAAGQAEAKPHPYGRGDASTAHYVKQQQAKTPRSATPMVVRWADRATRELHPYAKGSFSPSRSLRMIPTRGADGTNALCRSGSKAARWAC